MALCYSFPKLHSKNQFVIFVYVYYDPEKSAYFVFLLSLFKKLLYLQNYLTFIHFVAEQSKSNIHQTADKHLQHFLIKVFNHRDFELETSSKSLFLQKEDFSIPPAYLALLYIKAKRDDTQDIHAPCHLSSLKRVYMLNVINTLEDDCSFEEILKRIRDQICLV